MNEIIIPNGTRIIEQEAFKNCDSLEKVTMPDSVLEIGAGAFENCRVLKEIRISRNLRRLGNGAFKNCDSLREIVLPPQTEVIGAKSISEVIPTGNYCNLSYEIWEKHDRSEITGSYCLGEGRYLLSKDAVKALGINSWECLNLPAYIDRKMGTLVFIDNPAANVDPDLRRRNISWENVNPQISEKGIVLKKIADFSADYYNNGDEQAWVTQQLSRNGGKLPTFLNNRFYELCLCVFETNENCKNTETDKKDANDKTAANDKIAETDDKFLSGRVRVIRNHAFFPSLRRVIYQGKTYYVYSRNFLIGQLVPRYTAANVGSGVYDRRDMAVFDESGIIEERELTEQVYAKYKLFSIL